ncbi:MAG TPA: hypothetical protein VFR24_27365 [Candidatus Angelobacter sp.]|nr:hypothetical protein [Candidatus Angelobacter sp.]
MTTLVDAASILPNLVGKLPPITPSGDLLVLLPDAQNPMIRALRQQHDLIHKDLPEQERINAMFNVLSPLKHEQGHVMTPGEYMASPTGEGIPSNGVNWVRGM